MVYIKRWFQLCVQKGWEKWTPQLSQAIAFLTLLFDRGLSYSAINAARSALSHVLDPFDGVDFGKHPVVCRVLKGMYNRRPQRSRYTATWDVNVVLNYLCELSPVVKLTLKDLTLKLLLLLLLITCQRLQTIQSLNIDDMIWSNNDNTVVFRLSTVLKHSRRGSLGLISLKAFEEDPRLCIIRTLKAYLDKTNEVRDKSCNKLFITTTPPFKGVSTQTLGRWTKELLSRAGINTDLFKAHSVRGASTSKLSQLKVPVKEIMEKAAWSTECTFRKFYEKTIMPTDVSHKVLAQFIDKSKM